MKNVLLLSVWGILALNSCFASSSIIESGASLILESGAELNITESSTLQNNGSLQINGDVTVVSAGTIENIGDILLKGTTENVNLTIGGTAGDNKGINFEGNSTISYLKILGDASQNISGNDNDTLTIKESNILSTLKLTSNATICFD